MHDQEIRIGQLSLRAEEFSILLARHKNTVPRTPEVEERARRLIAGGFSVDQVCGFVADVCRWGNYAGIGGRVRRDNSSGVIAAALERGYKLALSGKPADGVEAIRALKGLGFSFASKHLRFLAPNVAVVLDRVMSKGVGYPMNVDGYRSLLLDCTSACGQLNRSFKAAIVGTDTEWRPVHVEMAIFAKLMGF